MILPNSQTGEIYYNIRLDSMVLITSDTLYLGDLDNAYSLRLFVGADIGVRSSCEFIGYL